MGIELDWHGLPGLGNDAILQDVIGAGLALNVAGPRLYLGNVQKDGMHLPRRLPPHAWSYQLTFEHELTPTHVEAIENARQGEQVGLELVVQLIIEDTNPTRTAGREWSGPGEIVRFDISRDQWSDILEGMGYGRNLLVAVPLVSAGDAPDWAGATQAFERAEKSLRDGLPRETVAYCREVLESLQRRWPRPPDNPNPSWSIEKRYGALVAAAKNVADPAHHVRDEPPSLAAYDLDDAKVLLAVTATLFAKALRSSGREAGV